MFTKFLLLSVLVVLLFIITAYDIEHGGKPMQTGPSIPLSSQGHPRLLLPLLPPRHHRTLNQALDSQS